MKNDMSYPAPGWVVQLIGHAHDIAAWEHSLKAPFDPWCERIPEGVESVLVLRSHILDRAESAAEARDLGKSLIDRLNGAEAALLSAKPLGLGWVGYTDGQGPLHKTITLGGVEARFTLGFPTITITDSNGNPIPPPPAGPSLAQQWIGAAGQNDDVADMLAFAGRADNWYDIYKTIEVSIAIAGDKDKWKCRLGAQAALCENMRTTANYYRHAKPEYKPATLTVLADAGPLLAFIVKIFIHI